MRRLARERGDPVGAVLRQARGGKASYEQRRWRAAEEQRDDLVVVRKKLIAPDGQPCRRAGFIKYNEAVRAGNLADPDRYLS